MALNTLERRIARLSLIAVWLWTAIVSALQADGLGADLLRPNPHIPPEAYPFIIWSGIAVDGLLGSLMALRPRAWVYGAAFAMTAAMTLIGTWVDAGLWLHPLGPLSKNLPILALLWLLAKDSPTSS